MSTTQEYQKQWRMNHPNYDKIRYRQLRNNKIQALGKRIKVYLVNGTYQEYDNVKDIYVIKETSIL